MNEKILSIIIPAYNVENYINKCLTSCINQNIPSGDYEIIIVEDRSTDNTLLLIKDFINQHQNYCFKLIEHKENKGLSCARNSGIEVAQGKYIWFVDSDDFISDNILQSLLQEVINNDLDMLWFNYSIIKNNNKKRICTIKKNPENDFICKGTQFFKHYYNDTHVVWVYFIKRDLLLEKSLLFIPYIYYEDIAFTPIAIILSRKIKYKNITAYHYLIRKESIMHGTKDIEKEMQSYIFISKGLEKSSQSLNNKDFTIWKDKFISNHTLFFLRGLAKKKLFYIYYKMYYDLKKENIIPIKYYGNFKRQILIFLLNNFNYLFIRICKYLY